MKSVALHNKLTSVFLTSFTLILFFASSASSYSQEIDEARQKEGKKIFRSQCASCHKLDKKLVGPALGNVEERRENSWLKSWIKNNAEFQKVNAEAAEAALYASTAMNAFPQLTDKNIDDILYYTTVGELPKKVVEAVAGNGTSGDSNNGTAAGWVIYLLGAAIVIAFIMIANLLKQVSELKGIKKPKSQSNLKRDLEELWIGLKNNTFLKVLGTIFVLLMGAYVVFGNLYKVGVDQDYQPIQPILFSHKIHAGANKVDCQYCHSSAKHSKHSGIPSVNVCMNCHKSIAEVSENTVVELEDGTVYGKEYLDKEIAKVYKAAGWDAENLEYTGIEKPIKWIRIHNLPDFVYFNHSQHVTVAGLKCQKCHGPVEEMEEMYQYSPLTMGWCINCHRETNVNLKSNEYYDKIHKQLAEKYGVEKVTAAQLGGLECGKCHY